MTTARFIFLTLALSCGLIATLPAVDDPANQSDFRFQPGSVSISNSTLRSRPIGNRPEATPRPEVSFTIQQNGFAPTITNVPIHFRYTSNTTGLSYTISRASQNIMGTTNSTAQRTEELIPPNSLPFGSYTLRIILDKDAQVCDRNRNNNTVVVTSSLNYVPTPSFRIFEFDVADHSYIGGSDTSTLKRFSAGETITLNYSISNRGETLPNPVPMRVDFYLTTIIPTTQQRRYNLPSRITLFGDPDTRFLGWDMGFTGDGNSASFTIPGDLEHLKYSVAAIANSDLAVPESTAGTATPIGFQTENPFDILYVFNRPDLRPSSTVSLSSTNLTTTDSLHIVSSIRNFGNMPSQGTVMHHYLEKSLFAGSSSVRYLLGTSTVAPMAQAPVEGSFSSQGYDVTFEIPDEVPSGNYTYRRIVDEIDVILERNEFNSSNSGPLIAITRSPLPNLYPSVDDPFVTSTTNAAEAGDSFTLSALVRNIDNQSTSFPPAPAPSFPVRFFLQPIAGNNPELQRVNLGTTNSIGTTAIGANKTVTLTTSLPGMNAGSYRLGYEIDPNDVVPERDDINNIALNPAGDIFQVLPTVPQLPDLIINKITPSTDSQSFGKQMAVVIDLANIGSGDAGPSQLRILLSPDSIADNNDAILVIDTAVPALDSGEEFSMEVGLTLPAEQNNSAVGSFYWIAEAGRNLAESDETNNFQILTDSLLKLAASDESLLPIIDVEARGVTPTLIPPGRDVTTFIEIINEGFFAASQLEVEIYLSTTSNFTPSSDLLLHSFPSFDLAGMGGLENLTREIRIPSDTQPGSYHILWVIDPDSRIPLLADEPLVAARSIQVQPLVLSVEVLEQTEATDVLAVYGTDEENTYLLFANPDLSDLREEELLDFEGRNNGPVILELSNSFEGEVLPQRFFQVQEK